VKHLSDKISAHQSVKEMYDKIKKDGVTDIWADGKPKKKLDANPSATSVAMGRAE